MHRTQMSRNAHRVGFGRLHQRMRRSSAVNPPPAPIGHNAMPEGDSEPEWLKERPMSDDWNQQNNDYHQNTGYHQDNQYQPHQDQPHQDHQGEQQNFQPHTDFQPEHQSFEPAHEPVVQEPVVHAPGPDLVRLDAVEAAIQELRNHIDEMKAALHAQAAAKTDVAEEHVETPAATDPHADRLAAIEAEIGTVKAIVSDLAKSMTDVHADVKANAALHDETRGIVDEQHQLMRGLNYIITSAIGTLTASAKTVK